MIELIFVVCLSATPTTCENRAMQFVDMTTTTCVMGAQPTLAQWVNEHPGWQIRRWTCRSLESGRET